MDNTPDWLNSILGAASSAAAGLINKDKPKPAPVVKEKSFSAYYIAGGAFALLLVLLLVLRKK